jgi:hypothetical protein
MIQMNGQRNHVRIIVDAVEGKCLLLTTDPQPLPPKDKKKK